MSFAVPAEFDSRVRRAEPLSRHTSWHVGGPADIFFMPRDRADLIAFLKALPADVPLLWLGARQQPAGARWRRARRGDFHAGCAECTRTPR